MLDNKTPHSVPCKSIASPLLIGLAIVLLAQAAPASAAFVLPKTDGTKVVNYNPFANGYGAVDAGREGILVHTPKGWAASPANAKYDVVVLLPGTNMTATDMSGILTGSNKNVHPDDVNFSKELDNEVIFVIPEENANKTRPTESRQWTSYKRAVAVDPASALDPNSFWDLRRLVQLRDDLKSAANPKVRSIYVGGFSAGGSMTSMLMCFAGNRFDGYGIFDGIHSSTATYFDCGQHWNNGGDVATLMLDKLGYPPVGFGVNSPAPAGQKFVRPVFMTTMTHSTNSGAGDLGDLYDTGNSGIPNSVVDVTQFDGTGIIPPAGSPGDLEAGPEDNKDRVAQTDQNSFEGLSLYSVAFNTPPQYKPLWQDIFEKVRNMMGSAAAYRTSIPNNSAGLSFNGTDRTVYYNGAALAFGAFLPGTLTSQPAGTDCTAAFCYRFANVANYCERGVSHFADIDGRRSGTLSVYMYYKGRGTNPNGASGKTGLAYLETRGGKHHMAGHAATCGGKGKFMEFGRTRDYDTAQLFIKFLQARAGLRRTH